MVSEPDVTLLGFNAVDIRDINTGDIVVFRSTSIAHRRNLILRHGSKARVTGFARNAKGTQQVTVCYLADERIDGPVQHKLTDPISLSPFNLVAKTEVSQAAGDAAQQRIMGFVAKAAESKRPWQAELETQLMLSQGGMYDRLNEPKPVQLELDEPF
jgi:hypothetical protein